ncbi:hypothetical protein GIB67_024565 [Kingdonia uniflora]|uniref:Protein kinase domain-containing protein n=1 Tax=Kingdonia uniflora TaxID=39325 RepID=A0A7J7LP70_9MAGN|nr:hypothetical protein GIB67_024565 [Kingdonia uniflora]
MESLKLYSLCMIFISLTSSTISSKLLASDVELLLTKIKPSLQGPSENLVLSSWNISVPICHWKGLKWGFSNGSPLLCSSPGTSSNASLVTDPSLQLVSLQLPDAGLAGEIPREISQLSSLKSLYLNVNLLKGSIPFELGYSVALSDVDLSENLLNGGFPLSMWNLCNGGLVELKLSGNNLSGVLPNPTFPNSSCNSLEVLDLRRNRIQGGFPDFVTEFHGLKQLDLGSNLFSGSVPTSLDELNVERLNLSYNNFSGVLPKSKFGAEVFQGNPGLCGAAPLPKCNRGRSGLSSGIIAALVIGFMTGVVVLVSLLIGYVQGKRRKSNNEDEMIEEGELEEENGNGGGEGKLVLFQGAEHLTLEDVLNATGQVMEKTSYGTVYKAKLADGGTIALRLLREGSCKDRGLCLPVIRQIGRVRHENLVPLRAFYQGQRGEKLLIYDYFPNKTLHDLLHGYMNFNLFSISSVHTYLNHDTPVYLQDTRAGKPLMNWARRHKIALGIARGLAHLHSGLETPITHGNVRSKGVILDEFFVARLAEFGLDKLMVPVVTDEMVAIAKADGYKAPELQKMKTCNSRTDVYAFGILLLEILIGKKPGKGGRNGEYVDLPALVKVAVLEETTMEVFDVGLLKGIRSPMEDGLVHALKLAMGCCAPVACVRPDMNEVVKQLEENRPRNRSALYSPTETRSGVDTPF